MIVEQAVCIVFCNPLCTALVSAQCVRGCDWLIVGFGGSDFCSLFPIESDVVVVVLFYFALLLFCFVLFVFSSDFRFEKDNQKKKK